MSRELDWAKLVFEGSLDLICPEMELVVCPNYSEVAMKGSGVIRSDKHGRLYFRLISPFDGAAHPVLRPSRPQGEMYQPHDHVMLRATDEGGRMWSSNWMIVDLSNQLPIPNWRLRKHLANVMWSRQRPKHHTSYSHVLIPGLTRLPFDMWTKSVQTVGTKEVGWRDAVDHHSQTIDGAEVTFRKLEDGWLSIFARKDEPFMPYWAGLMLHAIEFMAGGNAPAAVLLRSFNEREDLQLCSGPFWRYDSAMPGPVTFQGPQGAGDYWCLLERFFVFLNANWQSVEPILNELSGIRRGSQGSFQTACLTLAVGIESLSRVLLKDEQPPTVCKRLFRALLDHVSAWDGDPALVERAKGALGRLADVSAADRLYAWAGRTGVDRGLVDRWRKLRNPTAHGSAAVEEQITYDQYYSGVELLYRVIASAVGYDGPIVPTSQRGWGAEQTDDLGEEAPTARDADSPESETKD